MTAIAEQSAPDVYVYKADGTRIALQTYWGNRPVVITFLRHFGCVFCREFITKLRATYPDFVERGAAVIGVAQGSAPQAAHFANVFRIPFPILADPTREAYQAFGLTECTNSEMFHSSVMRETLSAAKRGHFPDFGHTMKVATSNTNGTLRQLGGTFIVTQDGRIHYAHVAKQVYEHPVIDELLDALDRITPQPVGVQAGC